MALTRGRLVEVLWACRVWTLLKAINAGCAVGVVGKQNFFFLIFHIAYSYVKWNSKTTLSLSIFAFGHFFVPGFALIHLA